MANKQTNKNASQESKSGRPPGMRPRDYNRLTDRMMTNLNNDPSWSNQVDRMEQIEDVQKKQNNARRGRRRPQNNRVQADRPNTRTVGSEYAHAPDRTRVRWEPDPASALSRDETPPSEEPVCHGVFRGSKPTATTACENFDFSSFQPLCRGVYLNILKIDAYFSRKCPYPMFLHYCTMLLNGRMLDYQRVVNKHPDLQNFPDVSETILMANLWLPNVIHEYIEFVCNGMTPSGEVVTWNLPTIAIPQGPIRVTDEDGDELIIQSGSYGIPTANNHNVYECYPCPYVTEMYMLMTITDQDDPEWDPFPIEWTNDWRSTPNVCCYYPREQIHREGISIMRTCHFTNDDTILGRIAYSAEVAVITSNMLDNVQDKIQLKKCVFTERDNSHMFVVKEYTAQLSSSSALSVRNGDLFSPFAFGSENANRAALIGLRRTRTDTAPGYCLLDVNGGILPGFEESRNSNFEMAAPFQAQPRTVSRASLRDRVHEEIGMTGDVYEDLNAWLSSVFVKEQQKLGPRK